jgi:hypothetical protein
MLTILGWYLALRYLFGLTGGTQDFLFVPASPGGAPALPGTRPAPALPSVPLSQSPAVKPWPSAPPSDLPPFPAGWEPDIPPPPEVVRRAVELLPGLWANGVNNTQVDLVGARWITFRAEWMTGGKKGVVAYRVKGSGPAAAAAPAPKSTSPAAASSSSSSAPMITRLPSAAATVPASLTTPAPSSSAPVDAAEAMYRALADHGYNVADQPIYKAFQASQKIAADGFPGPGTIGKLKAALAGRGLPALNVKTYPWKSMPGTSGYNGTNAPTLAEWTRPLMRGVPA